MLSLEISSKGKCKSALAPVWLKAAGFLKAPPNRTADEWADACRVLPAGSAEPGRYRSSRTPYCIPFMRAASNPRYRRVIIVMPSQFGKSASIFNIIGRRLDDDQAPVLYIGPTKSNIEKVIEPKIVAMLQTAPGLAAKYAASNRKSSKTSKLIGGVYLRLAWAGSPTELASDHAAIVVVDEVDKITANREGNVFEQAEARTGTYADGTVIGASTPTFGSVETYTHPVTGVVHWKPSDSVQSAIWNLWQEGTRHEWAVPCPHCEVYFVPRAAILRWPKEGSVWQRAKAARLYCPTCGTGIEEIDRSRINALGKALAPGEWVERGQVMGIADTADSDTYSEWVSGLVSFSPKKSFEFIARKLIRAYESGDPDKIQGVLNTDLGELYAISGDAPKVAEIAACQGEYKTGQVPDGVALITAGVDVQRNRLVYIIRGWGYGGHSWLLDYGELWGETDQERVWVSLDELLLRTYGPTEPRSLSIRRMAIDSGFRKDPVYAFCMKHQALAIPTKGHDHMDKPFSASAIEVTYLGRPKKLSIQLWHVDSDVAKSWVHARISDPERRWWVPQGVDDDYSKQMVAEERIVKSSGKVIWIVKGENHYLDAESLAYMAMKTLGFEQKLRAAPIEKKEVEVRATPRPQYRQPGFVTGWQR